MNYTLKNTLLLLALLFTVVCFQSCKEEGCTDPAAANYNADADKDDGTCNYVGCTDPNGENYDANAEEDDGSCTYARTKFIGSYGVGESCDGEAAESYIVTIAESTTATNEVRMTNESAGVTVTGTVTGDTLTYDDTFDNDGVLVTIAGDGIYSIVDDQEQVNATYTLSATVGGMDAVSDCVALWIKTD